MQGMISTAVGQAGPEERRIKGCCRKSGWTCNWDMSGAVRSLVFITFSVQSC